MLNKIFGVVAIQLSILGFFVPFYLRHLKDNGQRFRLPTSDDVAEFFDSPRSRHLIFSWAALEAIVWFVVPEFLLLLMVFMMVKNKVQLLTYDIAGTIAGTIIALLLSLHDAGVDRLPFVQPSMVAQVHYWYDQHGLLALLHQPFSGVPYKVFNHAAMSHEFNPILYIIAGVVVRVSRYAFFYLVFRGLYKYINPIVRKNYLKLFFVTTFVFGILLFRVYESFGPGYIVR